MKSPALAIICVLIALAAFAQTEGARISGRVTDLRGGVMVGAECKITNIETDVSVTTTPTTDCAGAGRSFHIGKSWARPVQRNGQRSSANYFMVDGVSANFGVTIGGLGQTLGGAIPGFTAPGGTNGLISVDAMQELRI